MPPSRAVFLPLLHPAISARNLDRWRKASGHLLATVLLVMLSGCATGDYAYVKTISTGERIQLPLEKGLPKLAEKGEISVFHAGLVPSLSPDQKELNYLFGLIDRRPTPPKSIRVDDVTDEKATLMVDDQNPALVNHRWSAKSQLFDGEDPEMVWITHLGDTMRVFRFTVTEADGSTTVLDQGWMVPAWAKVPMRRALGLK